MKELNLKIKMKMRKKVMKKENLPETTRRKIVMIKILRKSKMMTNPLFRKHPIRLPRLAEMSAFPAWWKRRVWVPLVM